MESASAKDFLCSADDHRTVGVAITCSLDSVIRLGRAEREAGIATSYLHVNTDTQQPSPASIATLP